MLTSLFVYLATATPQKLADITKPIEVPFHMTDNAMIVDAKVNGKDLSFMFDTGFGGWITCDAGINLGKPDGKMTLIDFVGSFEVDTVKIKTLKMGEANMPVDKDASAVFKPGEDHTLSYGIHCDGIMGFSVIENTITEINFQNKKMIFHPRTKDITKMVPDGKKTFLAKLLPTGNSSLEMSVKTMEGKSMKLALDTGNGFYATTHTEVLDRLGIWPISKKPNFIKQSFVASGAVDSYDIRMPKLSIFGVPVENSVWNIINLPSSGADSDGTVGFGFLKNFNIIIDYEKRRVWLENWTGKTTDPDEGEPGVYCFFKEKEKRWTVGLVVPGTSADKAGVKRLDDIISVDGVEMANIGQQRFRDKMSGKPGTKRQFVFSRNGQLIRKELELTPMINEPPAPTAK
jgi:hypothetical protein